MRTAIVFFQGFFDEAVVQHVSYVTDFGGVGRVVYPSWGATPRNFQFSGAGVVAALQPVKITREDGAIINIFKVVFWFDCSFFTACPRVVNLTALQTAGTFVCAHDYRAARRYGAGSPTAVVCSRELVRCGNGGTLCRS